MRQIAYNENMNEETRTLEDYIYAKLKMTVKKFCSIRNMPYRTLADQWHSEKGREIIRDQLYRVWAGDRAPASLRKFDDL